MNYRTMTITHARPITRDTRFTPECPVTVASPCDPGGLQQAKRVAAALRRAGVAAEMLVYLALEAVAESTVVIGTEDGQIVLLEDAEGPVWSANVSSRVHDLGVMPGAAPLILVGGDILTDTSACQLLESGVVDIVGLGPAALVACRDGGLLTIDANGIVLAQARTRSTSHLLKRVGETVRATAGNRLLRIA